MARDFLISNGSELITVRVFLVTGDLHSVFSVPNYTFEDQVIDVVITSLLINTFFLKKVFACLRVCKNEIK